MSKERSLRVKYRRPRMFDGLDGMRDTVPERTPTHYSLMTYLKNDPEKFGRFAHRPHRPQDNQLYPPPRQIWSVQITRIHYPYTLAAAGESGEICLSLDCGA